MSIRPFESFVTISKDGDFKKCISCLNCEDQQRAEKEFSNSENLSSFTQDQSVEIISSGEKESSTFNNLEIKKDAHIVDVPQEILRLFCRLLEPKDIVHLALTSSYLFTQIFSDDALWSLLLKKHFPSSCTHFTSEIKTKNLTFYKQFTDIAHGIKSANFSLETFRSKNVATYLVGHTNKLIFASGCAINILDLTRKEFRTLFEHTHNITCLTVYDDKLIFGSADRTIKIWDIHTGEELHTLSGHQDNVTCLTIYAEKLFSGSADHTIKIWNIHTGEEMGTLRGHQDKVSCLTAYKDKLFSGSYDTTINIWDILDTSKQPQTLRGHIHCISCLLAYGNILVSGSYDTTINIWDIDTEKKLKILANHTGRISCLAVHCNNLVSASWDKTIKIWDIHTEKEPLTLRHHHNIHSLIDHNNQLISSSEDKTIKIWDFSRN